MLTRKEIGRNKLARNVSFNIIRQVYFSQGMETREEIMDDVYNFALSCFFPNPTEEVKRALREFVDGVFSIHLHNKIVVEANGGCYLLGFGK